MVGANPLIAFSNKRVFVSGNTGFKGSWLTLTLESLGAEVIGYSNGFPTSSSLSKSVSEKLSQRQVWGDVRDLNSLRSQINKWEPDFIFHLAAQSVVSKSHELPVDTFETNAIGTLNVLETVRTLDYKEPVVIVTSDKCYENRHIRRGYVEKDRLGGDDPYSASKAVAEIIFASYFSSFFKGEDFRVATARAGNVIGGGDRTPDRLLVDLISSLGSSEPFYMRMPNATRPWQHVMDPVLAYLNLALKLRGDENDEISGESFNFGPKRNQAKPVKYIASLVKQEGEKFGRDFEIHENPLEADFKESMLLSLGTQKAQRILDWRQSIPLKRAVRLTTDWELGFLDGKEPVSLALGQVRELANLNGARI